MRKKNAISIYGYEDEVIAQRVMPKGILGLIPKTDWSWNITGTDFHLKILIFRGGLWTLWNGVVGPRKLYGQDSDAAIWHSLKNLSAFLMQVEDLRRIVLSSDQPHSSPALVKCFGYHTYLDAMFITSNNSFRILCLLCSILLSHGARHVTEILSQKILFFMGELIIL